MEMTDEPPRRPSGAHTRPSIQRYDSLSSSSSLLVSRRKRIVRLAHHDRVDGDHVGEDRVDDGDHVEYGDQIVNLR